MYKVIQTWHNDEFFYANIEKETRRFFFKKTKTTITVFTDWYKLSKQRGEFFKYTSSGKFAPTEISEVIDAYEARQNIANGRTS